MKPVSKFVLYCISAVFCTALTVSVSARATDVYSDCFAEAPAEFFGFQVIVSDSLADAPSSLPEEIPFMSGEDLADAPTEIPESMFWVSDDFADAPSEIPENIVLIPEEDFTEAPQEIPYETLPVPQQQPTEEIQDNVITIAVPEQAVTDVPEMVTEPPPMIPEETEPPSEPAAVPELPETQPELLVMDAPEICPVEIDFQFIPEVQEVQGTEEAETESNDFPAGYRGGYEDFLTALGDYESGNRYYIKNSYGYLGRFQIGKLVLQDVGFMDSNGNWTALAQQSYGIYSEEDFLNSEAAQNYAIKAILTANWRTLKKYGVESHLGEYVRGIEITKSGMLAAAHLVGAGHAKDIFQNIDHADSNQTSMYKYLEKMGNYYLDDVIP